MENYTLITTRDCYKNGKITLDEYKIIRAYIKARDKYYLADDIMRDYYNDKLANRINTSENKESLNLIKNELRTMPESVSKTLLFRHILIKEDELKKHNI